MLAVDCLLDAQMTLSLQGRKWHIGKIPTKLRDF